MFERNYSFSASEKPCSLPNYKISHNVLYWFLLYKNWHFFGQQRPQHGSNSLLDPPNIWQWPFLQFRHLPGGADNVQHAWFGVPSEEGKGADCTEAVQKLRRENRAATWLKLLKLRLDMQWQLYFTCSLWTAKSVVLLQFAVSVFCSLSACLKSVEFLFTGNVWSSLPESTSIEQLWLHFDLHFTSFVIMWVYRVYPTWVNSGNSAQYFPYLVSWSTGQRGCGARAMLGCWICFPVVARGGHQM